MYRYLHRSLLPPSRESLHPSSGRFRAPGEGCPKSCKSGKSGNLNAETLIFIRFGVFWNPKALYFLRFFIVFHVLDPKSGYKIVQTIQI